MIKEYINKEYWKDYPMVKATKKIVGTWTKLKDIPKND